MPEETQIGRKNNNKETTVEQDISDSIRVKVEVPETIYGVKISFSRLTVMKSLTNQFGISLGRK